MTLAKLSYTAFMTPLRARCALIAAICIAAFLVPSSAWAGHGLTNPDVVAGQIIRDSVHNTEITDSAVESSEIAIGAVCGSATGCSGRDHIVDGSISSADIATDSIVVGDLSPGVRAMLGGTPPANSITEAELGTGVVCGSGAAATVDCDGAGGMETHIKAGTIGTADLSAAAMTALQTDQMARDDARDAADDADTAQMAADAAQADADTAQMAAVAAQADADTAQMAAVAAQAAAVAAQMDADVVDSGEIADGTITTSDISAAAITALQTDATARTDAGNAAMAAADAQADADTAQMAADTAQAAADAAQADADVVDSGEIADGTITTSDISAAAITALQTDATARTAADTAQMAAVAAQAAADAAQADADVVDSGEIADGTITTSDISAAAITALQTDATARTAADTAQMAAVAAQAAADAAQADADVVDSGEIADGTITAADLSVDAGIRGEQIATGAIIVRGSARQSAGARSAQTRGAHQVQIEPGSIGFADFGDEVNNTFRRIEGDIDRLDEGIAMAGALSMMKIPAGKSFGISIGVGSYEDKQAMSLGIGFQLTDEVLFSVGGSYGFDSEKVLAAGSLSIGF